MEAIEVTVFRLSWALGDGLGAGIVSLFAEPLLESHEKLIPNFLGAGAGDGVGTVDLGARGGGGPQDIEGRFPERPCPLKGSFGGDAAMSFSVGIAGVNPDRTELLSLVPSSCTSSREEAEIRCAVKRGDFVGGASGCGSVSCSSGSLVVVPALCARGVETVEEGRPLVNERTELDSCDWGLEAVSWASSKVSYH